MFIHNLKYAIKTMLKNKTALIWTLLFPIALGTFMYMAFGKVYDEQMIFTEVPVAIVKSVDNEAFEQMIEELSKKGEDSLLASEYVDKEEALKKLDEEQVVAIVYLDEKISMEINNNSYQCTVVESVVNEYLKQEKVLTDIATNYPENLAGAIESITESKTFYTEKITSDGNQDLMTNYFYAIFAMSCLFASFGAIEKIGKLQGNVSALGMRRCLSPNSKMTSIVAEFLSMLIFQVIAEVLALAYFVAIGIDFGNKYPAIVGILVLGSCIGIAIGIIIGSISKLSENSKSGICVLLGMSLSVMADLCAQGIKDAIEHTIPIINRINPAALITDSFYALNIYDTYDRYLGNMAILGVMTIVLLVISYMMLRRNKYASV